jgi:hypothetical protein
MGVAQAGRIAPGMLADLQAIASTPELLPARAAWTHPTSDAAEVEALGRVLLDAIGGAGTMPPAPPC